MKKLLLLLLCVPLIGLGQSWINIQMNTNADPSCISWELVDSTGTIISSVPTGYYSHSFNLSEYSKGIYLLELDTDNGMVNKKLILQ